MTKEKNEAVCRETITKETRLYLETFLPEALSKALESYHRFSGRDVVQDTKEFSDHHAACKVAISHVELLLKLAKWADLNIQDANVPDLTEKNLADALADVKKFRKDQS